LSARVIELVQAHIVQPRQDQTDITCAAQKRRTGVVCSDLQEGLLEQGRCVIHMSLTLVKQGVSSTFKVITGTELVVGGCGDTRGIEVELLCSP
jgi:hypothetical protein